MTTDTMHFLLFAALPTLWLFAQIIDAALRKKPDYTAKRRHTPESRSILDNG